MSDAGALTRLVAARARLALDRPFLGALALALPLLPRGQCRSVATDGRTFYFNPEYVERSDAARLQFLLAHEALHCALGHFARRKGRLRAGWDHACDLAVNGLLADDGMRLPPEAAVDARYRGLSAEEIYALIYARIYAQAGYALPGAQAVPMPLDEHWFGTPGGSGAESATLDDAFLKAHRDGLDEVEFRLGARVDADDLAGEWRRRTALAALDAEQAGRFAGHFREALRSWVEPRLSWRELLARFLAAAARDDYSFLRRGRRETGAAGEALLPGMRSDAVEVVVALDTSASIGRAQFEEFVNEVDALKSQLRARVRLILCDAEPAPGMPLDFEPWQPIELPGQLPGGGGTRFTPVFDWLEREPVQPAALVYFTDAEGEFPAHAPPLPVLWVVMGRATVPFGERVAF